MRIPDIVELLLLLLSHLSRVQLSPPDSPVPGILQARTLEMEMKSESEVAQSCLAPGDPTDCSPPGSSVHGILQTRVLEWGAIAFPDCRTDMRLNEIMHVECLRREGPSMHSGFFCESPTPDALLS